MICMNTRSQKIEINFHLINWHHLEYGQQVCPSKPVTDTNHFEVRLVVTFGLSADLLSVDPSALFFIYTPAQEFIRRKHFYVLVEPEGRN